MDFLDLAKKRFSVRSYTEELVSDDDLRYVMEAVRLAPSACNKQPWRFVLVKSEDAKARLRQCYNRAWFVTAPMYIICLRDTIANWVRPDDGKPFGDVDVAIATEHLCLAAADRGLGTCWVCNFDVEAFHRLFSFPGMEPIALIPIGHVATDCVNPGKTRKRMDEITAEL